MPLIERIARLHLLRHAREHTAPRRFASCSKRGAMQRGPSSGHITHSATIGWLHILEVFSDEMKLEYPLVQQLI